MQVALPNFFLAGAGKAGTTSLYNHLRQHPQIYMSPVKEPCFFADEIRAANLDPATQRHVVQQTTHLAPLLADGQPIPSHGWIAHDWDNYLRLFQHVRSQPAIGEASAAYVWSPTAAANIAARIPHARIILILRDPAERAFSQYLHQFATGLTSATFRDHIRQCEHHAGSSTLSIWHPFLEAGLYSTQLQRYLRHFPLAQIRIHHYEQDWRDPHRLLAGLFEFLNVDPNFQPDFSRREHSRRAPRLASLHHRLKRSHLLTSVHNLLPASIKPTLRKLAYRPHAQPMDPSDRRYLIGFYREDILKLSTLWNRDLSAWLV